MSGGWTAAARCHSSRRRGSRLSGGERFFYRRPPLGHPVPDRQLIPFARLRRRPLERPAQGAEEPPDMTRVIGHAREPLDHRRDPRQRPEVRRQPMRAGPLAERLIDTHQLGRGQFRFPPRPPRAAQRGTSTTSPLMIPATHALPAHPQGAGDTGHDLARRKQAGRALPAQFQGVEIPSLRHMGVHVSTIYENLGECHSILRDSLGWTATAQRSHMPNLLALAQAFKIAAGLAQVALALWVLAAGRRTWMNIAFALSFGANGIAYAVFNLARPGTRTPGSFALEGRGLFNWIAVV